MNSSNNAQATHHESGPSPFKKNAPKESEEKGSNPSPFKPMNSTNSDVPSPFGTPLGGSPFKPLNQ